MTKSARNRKSEAQSLADGHASPFTHHASRITFLFSALLLLSARLTAAPNPFESGLAPTPESRIDQLVSAKWSELNLTPANLCSDAAFVRRVWLDAIGTLPSAWEAEQFIRDHTPGKRSQLIDKLLERDEFADYWAMKWSDLLRIKAEFPINLWPNAAQGYHRWVRSCIRENVPYDRFVRQLLTSNGSNFEVPQVNFYRALQDKRPPTIAQAVALAFMGARADQWPAQQVSNLSAFFSNIGYKATGEWKEEIIYFDLGSTNALAVTTGPRQGTFPDGSKVTLTPDRDPREVFADWLIDAKNPWFAQNIANRVWSWLLGRGIIEEADDVRPDNPPSNPELLAYLEKQLVRNGYDLKKLYREILNSKVYQLAAVPKTNDPKAAANFAYYPVRRLEAEVLIDALDLVTGTSESYVSAIPEPYTVVPTGIRSIALPDGSISSTFLELFGRPSRDTGLESERNNRSTASQRLWMLNSSGIQRKLEQSRMISFQAQSKKTAAEIASGMYLGLLSRFPTPQESRIAEAYFQSSTVNKRQATVDLAWALINSAEFQYRH
jgi:hypothetical protein